MDVAGIDIYHPTQDALTGIEISFGGDLARSMKAGRNYLVIETQAQGFPQWVPYPGQLRLQAFSHLASGANMLAYWHWHSIHNSAETYWKGLLSHDFRPNPTYDEAKTIGRDFAAIGSQLVNLRKTNRSAILFSNEALTAFNAFGFGWGARENYNDVLRPIYDALYRMNVGVDFIDPSSTDLQQYRLIVVPALYAAPDALLRAAEPVREGGRARRLHVQERFLGRAREGADDAPAGHHRRGLRGVLHAVHHSEGRVGDRRPYTLQKGNDVARYWMELLTPTTARVMARYEHPVWGQYAAITENAYGKGLATYVGFMPSDELMGKLLEDAVRKAGLWGADQEIAFPLVTKSGINAAGEDGSLLLQLLGAPGCLPLPAHGRKGPPVRPGRRQRVAAAAAAVGRADCPRGVDRTRRPSPAGSAAHFHIILRSLPGFARAGVYVRRGRAGRRTARASRGARGRARSRRRRRRRHRAAPAAPWRPGRTSSRPRR